MSSNTCEITAENSFLPTDFREFIDTVLEANSTSNKLIERVSTVRSTFPIFSKRRKRFAQKAIVNLEELLIGRRDIDAHYGWILASDAGLVYKSMGGRRKSGATWARQWMRGVFIEYERNGQTLVDVMLELKAW